MSTPPPPARDDGSPQPGEDVHQVVGGMDTTPDQPLTGAYYVEFMAVQLLVVGCQDLGFTLTCIDADGAMRILQVSKSLNALHTFISFLPAPMWNGHNYPNPLKWAILGPTMRTGRSRGDVLCLNAMDCVGHPRGDK